MKVFLHNFEHELEEKFVTAGGPGGQNVNKVTSAVQIRWNVKNAWPTKWTGPNLDAGGSEASIETLELVHEGIEVHKW